ncbi:hypothetical protein FHR24_000348 [Wenyingzhuangia heitensis]|uniref:RagB/SusD family nutrient uptake outer membrane protein n=1 Tax=Wenyingzhuangia heitensis TaxID=1487859 RepID=A0ABX0U4X9_9FLAO|nr:RagB/SusD family nutrient uptake outer membrane protein [Wenyingzhuangia heitensis]NIJ43909.1 hypothetical protein [Wenyingzhuangia heitensis]
MKKIDIRNKRSLSCLVIVLLLTVTSCSDDYLDVDAYGKPVTENFYKTPEDMDQALGAAYYPMSEQYTSYQQVWSSDLFMGDIGTDDHLKGGLKLGDVPFLLQKQQFNLTPSNPYLEARWRIQFNGILYANLILDKIDAVEFDDAERKKELKAEAYFLRAYYYFYLVNFYGGVPLYDTALSFDEVNLARATEEETYAFIEEDLKKAIQDLPSRFDKGSEYLGHADKGAALGLMMRVSLYQNKMDQVKTYGEQLFMIPYDLVDLTSIFQPEGEWNTESIFEINYSSNTSKLGTSVPKQMMPRTPEDKGFGFSQIKEDLINAYETGDPRLDAYYYSISDSSIYGTGWYNRKYSWAPFSNYQKPTVGGLLNSEENVRVIRLADAYLMYAEAIYTTNPTTAIEYVNRVRTRARENGGAGNLIPADLPLTLTGDTLRDAIYKERRLELAGEGLRFYDLLRTGRASTVLSGLGFQSGKNEVMPIPYSQIQLSKGVLTQNNY